jgi:hypothetical protein
MKGESHQFPLLVGLDFGLGQVPPRQTEQKEVPKGYLE